MFNGREGRRDVLSRALDHYRSMHIAAKAALWFVVCSFLQKGMSIITTPIFTRLMSTEQYGQVTVFNSWVNLLAVVTTLRLDYSVFNKGMSKFKDNRDEFVSTVQTVTTVLTLVCLVIYLMFMPQVNALTDLPTPIMFVLFAELLVNPAISFWTLRRRYDYIYRDVVARTIAMTVLNAVVGIIVVTQVTERGYGRILSSAAVTLSFGIPIYLYNLRKGHFKFIKEYARYAILFNLPLLAHYLSMYLLDQSDRIMIQKLVGLSAAALYGLTYNFALLLKIFTSSLNSAIVPWMYRKLEHEEFAPVDRIILLSTAFVCAMGVCVSIAAPEIVAVLAGEKYSEAVYVIPPVVMGIAFQFLYTMYANVEFYYDINQATMIISGLSAILNLGLNFILIPIIGYIAAAYTTLLCYIIMSLSHALYMKYAVTKSIGKQPGFKLWRMLIVTMACLICSVCTTMLYPYPIARYCFVFVVLMLMLAKRRDISSIIKMVRSR